MYMNLPANSNSTRSLTLSIKLHSLFSRLTIKNSYAGYTQLLVTLNELIRGHILLKWSKLGTYTNVFKYDNAMRSCKLQSFNTT